MPEQIVEYARSPDFRTVFIDNAVTVGLGDQAGARLQITFIRLDVVPTGERAQVTEQGIMFQPNAIPQTKPQKTVEFAVDMRPDTGLAVINNLIAALSQLPVDVRARYGVPEHLPLINPIPPR